MLKLATLIENPGEPAVESRYHDPHELQRLGYNGLVIYETTGLSGVENSEVIASGELRRWVQNHFDKVTRTIDNAAAAGLSVYLCYDAPVLARDIVARNITGYTCRNRPDSLCPASELTLDAAVRGAAAMLARWSRVAGLVLRFGDTDADRLPHLIGNDLYTPHCPRCSQQGRADRIVSLIERFHQLVVTEHGRQLIVRAWNVRPNGLHDSVELAQRVSARLPSPGVTPGASPESTRGNPGGARADKLIFSFKFTQTDFWRYQPWNQPSLHLDGRPILYELQCQREFEGKGAIPNWQVPLWRDGCPETREPAADAGLAHHADRVNLAGLWAWVRGGGWGGPFIEDETWIDANVFAVPRLADHPQADVVELGRTWIEQRLGMADPALAGRLLDVLQASPEIVRRLFYIGPLARQRTDAWRPGGDWISDDLLDAQAAWRIIQRLPETQLDAAVAEKAEAVEQIAMLRSALQPLCGGNDERHKMVIESLVNTLIYAESLGETLRDLFAGLVAYRRFLKSHDRAAADTTRQKLFAAQSHWNHHTQRHGSLPGAATAYREDNFWDLTQQILPEVT